MWWRFNETLGGLILLGLAAAVFTVFLLGLSIGRGPAAKVTGVVTGFWGREDEFGSHSGILARLDDGRVARLAQPAGGGCKVGNLIDLWDQPTLLGHRVTPRTQTCQKA